MQTSDAGLLFQTTTQLETAARRRLKITQTADRGRPIRVSSKILDFQVLWPSAWTAESGWLARRIDLRSGESTCVYRGHQGPVTSVAVAEIPIAAGGRWTVLFTGSWDKTIRVWDADSGEPLFILEGHSDFVRSLTILRLPDLTLVSTSTDRTFRLWDLTPLASKTAPTSTKQAKLHSRPIECCVAGRIPDTGEPRLWTADSMGVIKEWAVSEGIATYVRDWAGHETSIGAMLFVEDGFWSCSMDNNIIYHSFATQSPAIFPGHSNLRCICPLETGGQRLLLVGGDDEDIRVLDVDTVPDQPPKLLSSVPGHCAEITRIRTIRAGPDVSLTVVSSGLDGTLRQWTLNEIMNPAPLQLEPPKSHGASVLTQEEEDELADLMSDQE